MGKTPALILSIAMALAATAAIAQQPDMKVNVLVVESVEGLPERYPPSLKEVPAGRKVHFPILVGGLRPPQQGVVKLVADVEFLAPGGKSIGAMRQCCHFTITNRPDFRTAMLGPTTNLELEPGDMNGAYTVRVSVTDGSQVVSASETFQFTGGKSATPQAPASTAPRLRMDAPAKNPGRDVDKRDCLALPTPSEVIKCTERQK